MNTNKGFTLIELIVTLAVAAIIVSIALPSFSRMIVHNQMSTAVAGLSDSLKLARNEAVTKGGQVTITPSDEGWNEGWKCELQLPDTNIRSCAGGSAPKGTVSLNAKTEPVVFSPNGTVDDNIQFEIKHAEIKSQAYICVSLLGRIAIKKEACTA